MLIQKTFHIHQSLDQTRKSLGDFQAYRRQLRGVKEASVSADGTGHFAATTGPGMNIAADFAEVPCEKTDGCRTFRSVRGSIQFAGMCEFFPVKENLTEVVLTIDYRLASPVHRAMDWLTSATERFLNQQIEQIQIYFDGVHAVSHAVARELPRGMTLTHSPRFA